MEGEEGGNGKIEEKVWRESVDGEDGREGGGGMGVRGRGWKHMEESLHVRISKILVHTTVIVHTARLQEALDELLPLRIRAEAEKQRKPVPMESVSTFGSSYIPLWFYSILILLHSGSIPLHSGSIPF